MFHLNDDFKSPLSPAKWRNKVSAFLNNICGDGCLEVRKPEEPNSGNPPLVRIKWVNFLKELANMGFCAALGYKYATGETAAQTLANAQAVAANRPKPDKFVDEEVKSGNTAQQIADNQIALIGTSDKVARADHRHQLAIAQGTPKFRDPSQAAAYTSKMPSDTLPSGTKFALKTDTWKPNDTDGFNMLVISRIEEDDDEGVHYLFYRQAKVAKNGNIIEVGAELGATAILA